MESIHCPFSFPPFSSFLTDHTLQKRRTHPSFLAKRRHRNSFRSSPPLKVNALNYAVSVAANSPTSPGGDISVLLPVSAVLLFVYWIANFVVPQVISKDLLQKASDKEETPEQTPDSLNDDNASMPSKPKTKIKKEDVIKMIRPR